MTLLNVSLCLPALDVFALRQKHSIVAVTQRFIVPGKSFALLPCPDFPDAAQRNQQYQADFLAQVPTDIDSRSVTHWASCVLCQQLTESEAISAIAPRTIWTQQALLQALLHPFSQQEQKSSETLPYNTQNKSIFLAFLQVCTLPEPIKIETSPTGEQLYKFVPLPHYIEVMGQNLVLSPEDFTQAKERFLSATTDSPLAEKREEEETTTIKKQLPIASASLTTEEILDAADWAYKIAEYGNSSDGHTFEKLVRKGLIELGFRNSAEQLAASLNPKATGGAGGLDFYADQPYKIVGECKASKTQKINSDAATQLVRLGLQNLQHDEYANCIKVVVAAGQLTAAADKIAQRHRINIIRPEVMQRLVTSKLTLEDDFDLLQLKSALATEPFGEAANLKISQYIDCCISEWQERKEYRQLVEQTIHTVTELSAQPIASPAQDFSIVELRAHHNAKYQPMVNNAKMAQVLEDLYFQGKLINRRTHADGTIGYYLKPNH